MSKANALRIYNSEDYTLNYKMENMMKAVYSIDFSNDGKLCAFGGVKGEIRVLKC
jgi:hypothetical protein